MLKWSPMHASISLQKIGSCPNPDRHLERRSKRPIISASWLSPIQNFFRITAMHHVAISSTGLYIPPDIISNEELVESFNRFADLENAAHAQAIQSGTHQPIVHSSVEFIEKASGIKRRYVMEKTGVLDPTRMRPRLQARPDTEISLMAEIGVAAARVALAG